MFALFAAMKTTIMTFLNFVQPLYCAHK